MDWADDDRAWTSDESGILRGQGIWGIAACTFCGNLRPVERALRSLRCADCKEAQRLMMRRARYADASPWVEPLGWADGIGRLVLPL